jgi:hypothetical protein
VSPLPPEIKILGTLVNGTPKPLDCACAEAVQQSSATKTPAIRVMLSLLQRYPLAGRDSDHSMGGAFSIY